MAIVAGPTFIYDVAVTSTAAWFTDPQPARYDIVRVG
jgi:hypothetical protein